MYFPLSKYMGSCKSCVFPETIHAPLYGSSLEIPKGRGVLKAKLLEEEYEAKLQFPGGCWSAKQKNLL